MIYYCIVDSEITATILVDFIGLPEYEDIRFLKFLGDQEIGFLDFQLKFDFTSNTLIKTSCFQTERMVFVSRVFRKCRNLAWRGNMKLPMFCIFKSFLMPTVIFTSRKKFEKSEKSHSFASHLTSQ